METGVTENYKLDSEKLNSTIIELAIRLAFLGVILFLALSIIRPLFRNYGLERCLSGGAVPGF
jgi:hypothetical protein